MAIYADDFQSYAIGAVPPYGSLVKTGTFDATITNSISGIFTLTKSVVVPGISGLSYTDGAYNVSTSTFFGAQFFDWDQNILILRSGGTGGTEICRLYRNSDGTISVKRGGTVIGTTNVALFWNTWNWFQLNVTTVNVAGTLYLDIELGIDETSVLTITGYNTGVSVGSLPGFGVNEWEWTSRYYLATITVEALTAIGNDPNPGTPQGRATQATIEVGELPSSAAIRATQGVVEVGELPSSAQVRVTQAVIELVVGPAPITAICSQTPTGTVGIPYTSSVSATGGVPPYTFSITAGALPTGLSMDAAGNITGTPTVAGTFTFTIRVTGADGAFDETVCTGVIGITIVDVGVCAERVGPKIYYWEPSFLERPEDIAMRATDWDNAEYEGAKFVQGFILEADTMGQNKVIKLQGDQQDLETFTINHNGQSIKPYVFTPAKIATLLRLISPDDVEWRYFNIRFIWEPLPELVTYYETQATTHDVDGYQFLKDGYISLSSTDVVTLTVRVDGVDYTYNIPSTGGAHRKIYLLFGINRTTGRTLKGKIYRYILRSNAGFRLYQKDSEVRVHAWSGGEYVVKQPFGEVSRIVGARI